MRRGLPCRQPTRTCRLESWPSIKLQLCHHNLMISALSLGIAPKRHYIWVSRAVQKKTATTIISRTVIMSTCMAGLDLLSDHPRNCSHLHGMANMTSFSSQHCHRHAGSPIKFPLQNPEHVSVSALCSPHFPRVPKVPDPKPQSLIPKTLSPIGYASYASALRPWKGIPILKSSREDRSARFHQSSDRR